MSDHFLVIIPKDPHQALPSNADDLRRALVGIAGGEESRVKDYGKLQFIDAGLNFERVQCPACMSEIPKKDVWLNWMDKDWHGEEGFHLHKHQTPCCQTTTNLNDLHYTFPQGFAHWFISVRNTNRGPLTDAELENLEDMAGFGLRAISQMY